MAVPADFASINGTEGAPSDSPDDFSPPDDFGAAVIAEFEKRAAADDAGDPDADAPPGGWPEQDGTAGENPGVATAPSDSSTGVADEGAGADAESSDATAPAPDPTGKPDPTAEVDPATDPPPAADPEGGVPPAPPSGYTWHDGDNEVTFTDDQVQHAIGIAAWAEQLPHELRNAFSAVETGQAVPIPRAEYDQFVAWRDSQTRTQRDADLDDLDPETAKSISALRDEINNLKGQQSGQGQGSGGGTTPAPPQNYVDQAVQQFDTAVNSYGSERGITDDDLLQLRTEAAQLGIVPILMEQNATYSPTGQLIREADIALVTQQALDFALVRNPALHNKVIAAQHSASTSAHSAPQPNGHQPNGAPNPPSHDAPQPDPVLAKRARAASLATAPSAATNSPPRSGQVVSPQELTEAMAADIAKAIAASQ